VAARQFGAPPSVGWIQITAASPTWPATAWASCSARRRSSTMAVRTARERSTSVRSLIDVIVSAVAINLIVRPCA
jgi:hypothetical protein